MKKTNKENPLTSFRKMYEAREKTVKSSLKKAQDGIEMNDMMINKPGSTGGYKKTVVPKFWENDTNKYIKDVSFPNATNSNALIADMERLAQGQAANQSQSQGQARSKMQDQFNSALINRKKSNTPMLDSMYPSDEKLTGLTQEQLRAKGLIKKTGGTHKMPNGKVMLNSAMKKGGSVKKKK